MNVGTISLVGISVVFFTFVVLFLLFKLLAKLFGDKQYKKTTISDKLNMTSTENSNSQKNNMESIPSEASNTEIVAAITAALCSFTSNNIRILNIKEKGSCSGVHWRTKKAQIWRPLRKGVKKSW